MGLIIKDLDTHEVFDYKNLTLNSKFKQTPLDPNHSHFILVDNAQENMFGGEINLRGKLESAISKSSNGIPVVVLVLEGGPNTLETVLNSVKNGSPCVFIEVYSISNWSLIESQLYIIISV